jgi:AAA+ superfamily predicted ATPase
MRISDREPMSWVAEFKAQYMEQKKSVFIFSGNTKDLFELETGTDVEFSDYVAQSLFASRDVVLEFNIGTGLKFRDTQSKEHFQLLLQGYDALKGTKLVDQLPADSGEIFRLLDRFLRIYGKEKSIGLIINYAQLLIPADDLNRLSLENKKVLVTLQDWAVNQEIVSRDLTIALVCDSLSQLHQEVVSRSEIAKIEVDFPDETVRAAALTKFLTQFEVQTQVPLPALIKATNGLNRKNIYELMSGFRQQVLELKDLGLHKKDLIEEENAQFIEFVESKRTLEDFAGSEPVKKRLREDAQLIKEGNIEVVPMGYLICGPVGTGKSYLAECFAGEAGIPVVKLQNFRDRWVGSTESNFERLLGNLKNLAPVIVLIDEADAALGNREQSGDSGTSQRVFAQLAQTMGDTANRGKLIWMLLTSRPELLPVDLKRQGRAEMHIPLFYPEKLEEKKLFVQIIAKKVGLEHSDILLPILTDKNSQQLRSGADIESFLVQCKRQEVLQKAPLTEPNFKNLLQSFRSSISSESVAHQVAAAKAEITDMTLLES